MLSHKLVPLSPENRNFKPPDVMKAGGYVLIWGMREGISVGRCNTWPDEPQQSCDAQPAQFNRF
jgi:hypothetical protein